MSMKKYSITVNGTTYQVDVEEVGGAAAPAVKAAPVAAPVAAPAPVAAAAPAPAPAAAPAQVSAGDTPIKAPMPGKVTKLIAREGQKVKKGDTVIVLEAMKMQNEIGSPVDGTVKSINVSVTQNVKPGEIMAVIG